MWRSLIRIAPLAMAGFQWWKRRQAKQNRQQSARPPQVPEDRLP
ncbi:hypothetical protein [Ornithinimicrobium cryptoxanthini]|nr:hypothetical protein [Ornithinimicrobium cryptoxanthini]